MRQFNINVDANRGHRDEPWRLDRLMLLKSILEHKGPGGELSDYGMDTKINSIYDSKGWLTVDWASKPSLRDLRRVSGLWSNVFNEEVDTHTINGEDYLDYDWELKIEIGHLVV